MSTTETVSNSVLSQYAGTETSTTNDSSYSSLGKDDFLMLLVTQLNNQNPLDPQSNTEFVSQLAQFSSLESLSNISASMDSLLGSYQSSQALQASSLVGRSVMVSASSTQVDGVSGLTGTLVVPTAADNVSVRVYDEAGSLVKSIPLDNQSSAGLVDFTWDGSDESGQLLPAGTYKFSASASLGGTSTALETYLPATVNSVTLGIGGGDMTLNLAGAGNVALSKVISVGQ